MKNFKYIDLFAGAGGLSEGFIRAGFIPIAHIEMNKDACNTLRTRAVYHYLKEENKEDIYIKYLKGKNRDRDSFWNNNNIPPYIIDSVINTEISEKTLPSIFEKVDTLLNQKEIDVIIGGPPCQAYSVAGRARDPKRMSEDPRNFLYKYYVEFLKKYQPKMFIFENVPGILSASNGKHLDDIIESVKEIGYEISLPNNAKKILNAKDFGVLQDRKRVIIIGWKKELNLSYPDFEVEQLDFEVLKDLFSDLKPLKNGEGSLNAQEYHTPTTKYL
ncbi:MAG: DNA (cytosine-5-)-methyltransferase, partial [Capnocytophaga sp.]|nr:DNA (cytosine-5-)-methyltransferase [Capnocytophaga sp.]